jgi:hypothetical protein
MNKKMGKNYVVIVLKIIKYGQYPLRDILGFYICLDSTQINMSFMQAMAQFNRKKVFYNNPYI